MATSGTVLTKKQTTTFGPTVFTDEFGQVLNIVAQLRYDDSCGNGHNSFSITATVRKGFKFESGGYQHELIAKHFPELAEYIKWHLCSTNGPLHYVANTVHYAKTGNLEYARSTAIWPDATLEQLLSSIALQARLPQILVDFRAAMESLGFTY